jgi:hypothetical protein
MWKGIQCIGGCNPVV